MKPILQNLVEMTGQRDHLRLEVSVLSTLQKLSNIVEVRALELFSVDGVLYLRPRTWKGAQDWASTEMEPAKDPQRQALENYPALAACIHAKQSHVIDSPARGRHVLWLPVWMHDKVNTCLEIRQKRPFSAHRLEVITGIFNVYQNYQSLLDYSERDALTGLYNRKTFDEQFARHSSSGGPDDDPDKAGQWLAVIDIDHFKQVNDRFGHLYGDEVLILVANVLRSSFRSHDRIFRFGGEEFVVLLRSTSLEDARSAFNRFREAVQEYPFPQVGQVTVSLGFINAGQGSPVEILGQADQALYYAKEHGRNQVCFYNDLIASGDLTVQIAHDDVELF
ncbi:GGDEF domain-containing protein [Giesbergeria anulus]|uniref:diguanylate cyclase n=1 Tax=Giesbergeria anulus TaxID=180197 RepID=A0A1H9EHD4_9BURK|nr:GGDEF domain-containing protein [Giesbergeria anulus]SEQ24428.1 diguanylate cyclase (GGDEF) domain-containing protein [Giesbergeria anulus]